MQAQQVQRILEARVGPCEVVDKTGIFRCERRSQEGADPYAVIYVDSTGDVPAGAEALLGYEEKVIGRRFFETPKHLKWNHYLVFAVEPEILERAATSGLKQEIETDTTYARKFVVSADKLDDFFAKPSALLPEPSKPQEDPTLVWKNELVRLGLDRVINARFRSSAVEKWLDSDEPTRVASIPSADVELKPQIEDGKRILGVKWSTFRPFPTPRPDEFRFGDVNLFYGVNGSGKTSLMEAIETFFCGGTLRNGLEQSADVQGMLEGTSKYISLPQSLKARKERELRWFGKYWRGKQELSDKFNKYIYFNSDAAYRLEHDDKGQFLGSALANVALGTEANHLWQKIEEFHEVFKEEVRRLERRRKELDDKVRSIRSDLARLRRLPLVSAARLEALKPALQEAGWKRKPKSADDVDGEYVAALTVTYQRLKSLERLLNRPLKGKNFGSAIRSLEAKKTAVTNLAGAIRLLAQAVRDLDVEQERISRLLQYFRTPWARRYVQASNRAKRLDELDDQLRVLEDVDLDTDLDPYLNSSLSDALRNAKRNLSENEDNYVKAKRALKRVEQLHGRLDQLRGEIKALGRELVESEPDVQDCPLCNTRHPKGALLNILSQPVGEDQVAASEVSAASRLVGTLERQSAHASAVVDTLQAIVRFSGQATQKDRNASRLASVRAAIQEIQGLQKLRLSERAEYDQAAAVLRDFSERGFSDREFSELWGQVYGGRRSIPRPTISEIQGKIETGPDELQVRLDLAASKKKTKNEEIQSKRRFCENELEDFVGRNRSLEEAIEELSAYIQDARRFEAELAKVSSLLKFPEDIDTQELVRRLEVASGVASELLQAISIERTRREEEQSLEKQMTSQQVGLERDEGRLKRAEKAFRLLSDLKRRHSKEALVARFINENSARISEILRLIHAPREFEGLAPLDPETDHRVLLVKSGSKKRVELTQISTGQRCAVALAIYFTLNLQTEAAPPLIMMDDPIPHIDDLNTLALLDYLREIAVNGRRQIFFATANEKLAGIFNQKFSALKQELRPFRFDRPA